VAWKRTLLVVLAAATLAVAGTSLVRTIRGFYQLDFTVTWERDRLVVDSVPAGSSAADAFLEPGDRIVSVDGTPVSRLEDPIFVLSAGDSHRLRVRDPLEVSRELTYIPPSPEIDPVYLARSLVGLVGLGCALFALFTTRRREAATFVLLACAAVILGTVPHRTAASGLALQVIHRVAGAALPFLVIRFFAIFPERIRPMRALDTVTVVTIAVAAATAVRPEADAWWSLTAPALRTVFVAGMVGGIAIHVRRWLAASRDARIRRQIEWAALGLFVGLVPYVVLVAIPRALGIAFEPFSWMAVLSMVALPLTLLAAMREYRLWDLEPITRELLTATLVVVTGGFIFAVTNYMLMNHARSLGPLRNLTAFATGVLLVVLLQPVRLRVQRFLDEWLYHGRLTPRWLLTNSARELADATDPRELLVRLTETLREGLDVEHATAYLRAADGSFVRMPGSDGTGLPDRLPAAILGGAFPHHDEAPLASAGYAARVPLDRAGTTHGLLYLGLRRGIFPLGTESREVVSAFAAQSAVALESARYLDDLRRQAEEYRILHANTQRIIESSAAAILVCDAAGRILSSNSEAADIFHAESTSLVGQDLASLVELPRHWESHLPLHAENAESRTKADPVRRVVMAVSVLELDSGSFNGRVVVLQDITELRELQDRMREQERLASLGRLASGLAHEINTPLTGIASFAQMLGEMTPDDDPRARLVRKLEDQSFRVSRIVSNLREAVRSTAASQGMMDLGPVVEQAARDTARSLGAGDRVRVRLPPEPVSVNAAPGPVELAVGNLVRNALEASPPDTGVTVSVEAADGWGVAVVEDDGPGVPPEILGRVFEPFVTTKTERGGTGLGLAISRDMISQLGGEVRLENREEGGTRATVRLQLWKVSEASS
jgi:PAS domain S-box-containing protein